MCYICTKYNFYCIQVRVQMINTQFPPQNDFILTIKSSADKLVKQRKFLIMKVSVPIAVLN